MIGRMSNMTVEEIKEAIDYFKTDCSECNKNYDFTCSWASAKICNFKKLACLSLEKELERLENKSLSIDEIRDSIGEPLWVELKDGTFECLVLRDYDDKVFKFEDCIIFYSEDEPKTYIYKYKRTESENE